MAASVVARDADAEVALGQPDRVRRLEVAVKLLVPRARHVVAQLAPHLLGRLGLGDDRRAIGDAGHERRRKAGRKQRGADAVLEDLALRLGGLGARRRPAGVRQRRLAPPREPPCEERRERPDEDQVGEGRDQNTLDEVDAVGRLGWELVEDEAVEQREHRECGPLPRPPQTPAKAAQPETLA